MKRLTYLIILILSIFCSPVLADEFRGGPQRGADDGDQGNWLDEYFVDTTNTDECIELRWDSAIDRWGGAIRFQNVTIPQGSIINIVYIKVTTSSLAYVRAYDSVTCQAVDNATFLEGGYTRDIEERWAFPTVKILWADSMRKSTSLPDSTCDLKTILQPIIDRVGWISGNSVMFLFKNIKIASPACSSMYEPLSFESSYPESLLVDYTPPVIEDTVTHQMRLPGDWRFRTSFNMDWRFQDVEVTATIPGPAKIYDNGTVAKTYNNGTFLRIYKYWEIMEDREGQRIRFKKADGSVITINP